MAPSTQHDISTMSFGEHISTHPNYSKRILGNLHQQDVDAGYWLEAINNNNVMAVSDGSMKDGVGMYAIILKTEEKELHFQGP
eukprot:4757048-Ditylum_brightwellii.AAC.1